MNETATQPAPTDPSQYHAEYFTMLGYDQGVYYYLPRGTGQILALRSSQHVESNFIDIAPRNFWEEHYGGKQGPDWRAVHNSLIRRQQAIGIYDPSRIRGRGAWWDHDRAVVHVGDRIIINGQPHPLSTPGRYIYEASIPYPISSENPLSSRDSYQLIEICKLVSWEKPINAYYLAGWVALAPIGGALNWRPHIWLTASAESGKSTITRDIVSRILAGIAIGSQSCTTEPAIRGEMRSGSLPVIFDEAESKSAQEKLRMDAVVGLARAASTEGGDPIMKANPDGTVRKVYSRSMFMFSSISYPLTKPEDMRRITPLGIIKDGNLERYERLKLKIATTLTDEFCSRFPARSIKMIPTIRKNSRIFAAILVTKFKSQGLGDQYGMLLAGAWSLFSDEIVTPQAAEKWINDQDAAGAWTEQKIQHTEDTDEAQCLAHLRQTVLRAMTAKGALDISIAELMDIARGTSDDLRRSWAIETLGRHGLRGDPDQMVVSVSHTGVAKIFKDTAWARNWGFALKRLPGAARTEGTVRFGADKSRGIEIPYTDENVPDGDAY